MNKNKIHSRNIKLLTFDLDTNELKKYYPTNNWHNAYEDIRKHIQFATPFSWPYIIKLIFSIPWLSLLHILPLYIEVESCGLGRLAPYVFVQFSTSFVITNIFASNHSSRFLGHFEISNKMTQMTPMTQIHKCPFSRTYCLIPSKYQKSIKK